MIGQTTGLARRLGARAVLSFTLLLCLVSLGFPSDVARAGTTPSPSPATSGQAAGSSGLTTFGIKPSHKTLAKPTDERPRFDYAATPGAAVVDYVAVTNYAKAPVVLRVYASDGFNTTADGFDLLPATKKPVDVGSWVSLAHNVVDVKAGATAIIPFTLRVPMRVTPGDHVGGIVASVTSLEADKKGDRVAVDHRVGVRIYLRVQGALDPRLTVTNLRAKYHRNWLNPFGSGKVTVSYTVHNVGNVRLGAGQSVQVAGWYGGTVQSPAIADVTELLPENNHDEKVVVHSVVPAFHDKALVTVNPYAIGTDVDGRLVPVTASIHFWAVPWTFLGLALIVLLLAGFFVRRRLSHGPSATPAQGQAAPTKSTQPAAKASARTKS